jgi:SIR2-like domain
VLADDFHFRSDGEERAKSPALRIEARRSAWHLREALSYNSPSHYRFRQRTVKKKLVVILGSGSSIPLGFPSVDAVNRLMKTWASDRATVRGWPDYFGELWDAITRYQLPEVHSWFPPVNYERVLANMLALSHWVTPPPSGDPLRGVLGDVVGLSRFPEPNDHGPELMLREQISFLTRRLVEYLRDSTRKLNLSSPALLGYLELFERMRREFEVGVFTLNYDGAAIRAMAGAYTGFDTDGRFDPAAVHRRCSMDFVYHLHGSVHYSLRNPNGTEMCWRDDLSGDFIDDDGAIGPALGPEWRLLPVATIVAGGFKLDQLLAEPFHSFQAALTRHLYDADAILIGGYGFADMHVNRALTHRLSDPERPPVMILDRRNAGALSVANEPWKTGACSALRTDGWFFTTNGDDRLEVNPLHRVALWRHGFITAGESPGLFAWLKNPEDVRPA